MAAEGDPVAETSTNYVVDSLPVPLLPKKMKGREECKILEKVYWTFRFDPEMDRQFKFKP
jgi:hypothetical protein